MEKKTWFASIPKVDDLIKMFESNDKIDDYGREIVVESIRAVLDSVREHIKNANEFNEDWISLERLYNECLVYLERLNRMRLRRVINGTGVVLHTNLGRSLIAQSVLDHLAEIAGRYSNLEYDLEGGVRGSRHSHVEGILCRLTGAEGALVVNNNAAAVMLALATMAHQKEVIISRGELIEIGGSFRVPEVMKLSGAKMIEVGTTNKTHLYDYEDAITEDTALLLKVHTSNFKVMGFSKSVALEELKVLGEKCKIPVMEDLGSGILMDLTAYGVPKESTVRESVASGIDIVTFSGDKLLGGPQAGIVVGKREYIERMKKHQLARAFRIDKMTLAALEGTLKLYLDEGKALQEVPTLRLLTMPLDTIRERAQRLIKLLESKGVKGDLKLVEGESEVGGGAMPLVTLPTVLLSIKPEKISINDCTKWLRAAEPPVVCRVQEEQLLFDLRTIMDDEVEMLSEIIHKTIR